MSKLWTSLFRAALLFAVVHRAFAKSYTGDSHVQVQRLQNRAAPIRLDPIHPSVLRNAEGRIGGSHSATGDYIMQGLSGTMDLVTKEYGLRDSESFYWGPNGNPIANLTAYADGKAVRVLSLERFDNVLEKAECGLSSIKLTFTKEVNFDAVQKAWKWVNDADDNYIVLITESAQCNVADGDETIRQPWHVTTAVFDDNTNIVTLTAEPKTWAEAFSNWHLRVRSTGLLPQQQHTPRDTLDKRLDIKLDPKIDLSMDFSNASMSFSDSSDSATASMTCTQCQTYGSLDFDIDITPVLCNGLECLEFWNWKPYLEGHIQVVADGIGAVVQIKTSVSGAASFMKVSKEIFRWEPPIGRIVIPGVLDIGPELKFLIASDIGKIESKMDLTTGLELDIPNDAIYYIDVHDSANDQTSDWTPKFTPLQPEADGAVSLNAQVGGELHLDFAGNVMGIGTAELGIFLAAPTFSIKASMFEQTGGACDVADADYGTNLEVDVGMSLDAYEQAALVFGADTVAHVGATQTLWSATATLFTTCFTVDATDYVPPTATATISGMPYASPNGSWHSPYPTAAYSMRA